MHRRRRTIVGISFDARVSPGRLHSLVAFVVCVCVFASFPGGCTGQISKNEENAPATPTTPKNPTSPTTPTGLVVTGSTDASIDLSWTAVSGADGYRIYRSNSASGTYVQVGNDVATTTFNDASLLANTTYWYRISAYNANGESNQGGAVSGFTTPAGNPEPPPVTPAASMHWSLAFAEEFQGTDYDHAKLSPCFDWNYGDCTSSFNQGLEHYLPSQVVVSDGTAKLIAAPLSPVRDDKGCYDNSCIYKSGLLSTCRPSADNDSAYLFAFTYGYVEARMKIPGTQGFFTAFWLLPADTLYTYSYEIDIIEVLGNDPTTIYMTYHYNNRSNHYTPNSAVGSNGACAVLDYSQDFHIYAVDWASDHVAFYLDGTKCGEYTGSDICTLPMQIILNHMVSVQWQRDWNVPLLDTNLTEQIEVDYLRVWQQVP